jgi:hypothetical protein
MTGGDETHMAAMLRCMQYLMCTKVVGLLLKPTRKWNGSDKFFQDQRKVGLVLCKGFADKAKCPWVCCILGRSSRDAQKCHAEESRTVVVGGRAESRSFMCSGMLYGKNLLESIGLKVKLPMMLEINNKGAVDLINNFTVGGSTHHFDVKKCFLQELKESKQLIVNWISGSENNADMFTKN